jgi:hypothetical protein
MFETSGWDRYLPVFLSAAVSVDVSAEVPGWFVQLESDSARKAGNDRRIILKHFIIRI